MQTIAIDDAKPLTYLDDADGRGLSDPLDTADVVINHYRLDPGERLFGLHTHVDQEEVFVVLDGEATFETLDGRVSVAADEAIRFGPGDYQSATNDAESEVELLALGAPKGTEDWRVPLPCPDCGFENLRPTVVDGDSALVCPDCEEAFETSCAACGGDEKVVTLADDGKTIIDFCPDCGAESAV